MKSLFILSFILIFSYANEEKKVQDCCNKENILEQRLSDKEKAYQDYRKKLEEENKKLEDDGFCSCNND